MPLTEKQKKLPPALQKAILAKQEKDSTNGMRVNKKPKMTPSPKKNKNLYKR